jgi:hypothetical protein
MGLRIDWSEIPYSEVSHQKPEVQSQSLDDFTLYEVVVCIPTTPQSVFESSQARIHDVAR